VHSKIKSLVQYLIMIVIMVVLLWLSLRGITVSEGEDKSTFIWNTWERSNKSYLFLMVAAVMLSHVIRAERWRMLLEPTGNKVSLGSSFLSLMIGYLVNMAVPRGGEVSRCYNLYKLEKTPIEVSFGTVVVDRIVDVITLMFLIGLSFIIEWTRLKTFMDTLEFSSDAGSSAGWWILLAVVILGGLVAAIYFLRKNEKVRKIMQGFKEGLMAVFRLKNKGLFIVYSIAIWALYFLMSYLVMIAFPETQHLSMSAVLTLFAIGAIAMAAPLPGGAGSYHTLVPLGLVMLYQVPKADAIAFVFVFHAWQTLITLIGGIVSLIISYLIVRWKRAPIKS
jgi:glycosyltransferase 2 family protein